MTTMVIPMTRLTTRDAMARAAETLSRGLTVELRFASLRGATLAAGAWRGIKGVEVKQEGAHLLLKRKVKR